MFTVLYLAHVYAIPSLVTVFYIMHVCHNLFYEIVQIYYVWLLTYADYRSVNERHVVS